MSLARGASRLMTPATCGPTVMPRRLASLATLPVRPDILRPAPPRPARGQTRQMHWAGAIQSAIQVTEDSLIGLYSVVGLPWYLTIPVFALGVNLVVRMPLQIYARNVSIKQTGLIQFIRAWRLRHAMKFDQATAVKQTKKSMKRLFRERGCQTWKMYTPLLSIPSWLVVSEALRRITGTEAGLLSLFVGSGKVEAAEDISASPVAVIDDGSAVVETVASAAEPVTSAIQQSLSTGGALWFPDLTAADPYAILPFMLSASILYNVLPSDSAGLRAVFNLAAQDGVAQPQTPSGTLRLRVQRILVVTSILFPFITMNIPTGMLLYWVSSSALAGLNIKVVDRIRPIPDKKSLPVCTGKPLNLFGLQNVP